MRCDIFLLAVAIQKILEIVTMGRNPPVFDREAVYNPWMMADPLNTKATLSPQNKVITSHSYQYMVYLNINFCFSLHLLLFQSSLLSLNHYLSTRRSMVQQNVFFTLFNNKLFYYRALHALGVQQIGSKLRFE